MDARPKKLYGLFLTDLLAFRDTWRSLGGFRSLRLTAQEGFLITNVTGTECLKANKGGEYKMSGTDLDDCGPPACQHGLPNGRSGCLDPVSYTLSWSRLQSAQSSWKSDLLPRISS